MIAPSPAQLSSDPLARTEPVAGHVAGWQCLRSVTPVDYLAAVTAMESRVADIAAGAGAQLFWLLEHPALYTAGTSARAEDLLTQDLPVYQTGRGGQYTYHGPGQRVAYVMCDLRQRGQDLRRYVFDLEEVLIRSLSSLGVKGERREGRVGIWVDLGAYGRTGEAKIAAIGVRVRRGVTYHGVSLNVSCDLGHFAGIVPCGISAHGVTSLADLGKPHDMAQIDAALQHAFAGVFESSGDS